ncbi:hypothetical protein FRC06_005152, partial [Ceratobasidium sp. 370]
LFLNDRRGTIAPLIVASDKTKMTKLSGNKSAYPVYLSIGNISKTYQRQATKHATVVIGYLPIDNFKDVPSETLRKRLKGELIHTTMASLMQLLEEAGQEGVEMWCADGRLRHVYPLLAAFVGDWPEQCNMACVTRSGCPKCLKRGAGRGDERKASVRTRLSTLLVIDWYLETGRKAALEGLGLKSWWPWWANLPGAEFATCVTPDLLHQLHKGLFKGHTMQWIQRKLRKRVVDQWYMSMPRASGLRHFKQGISTIEQWTGCKAKEVMKMFVPLIAEDHSIHNDVVAFIRAPLDFCYIAHAAQLTKAELEELQGAHADMHWLKHGLVRSGVYKSLRQLDDIPKWHMISHYADSIRKLGMPDRYNTEGPECLHIVYMKRGWAASNKRKATQQIITYCQRLEALHIHQAHLDGFYGPTQRRGEPVKLAVFIDDNKEDFKYWPEDGAKRKDQPLDDAEAEGDEGEWEDWEDREDQEDLELMEEGRQRATTSGVNDVEHLAPEFAITIRPTKLVTLPELVNVYGATSLNKALKRFLRPYAHGCYFILPHECFDVWHKLALYHHPLSFAPNEPSQRNIIQVQPPVYNERGCLRNRCEPVFDTALFVHDREKFGLHRTYR